MAIVVTNFSRTVDVSGNFQRASSNRISCFTKFYADFLSLKILYRFSEKVLCPSGATAYIFVPGDSNPSCVVHARDKSRKSYIPCWKRRPWLQVRARSIVREQAGERVSDRSNDRQDGFTVSSVSSSVARFWESWLFARNSMHEFPRSSQYWIPRSVPVSRFPSLLFFFSRASEQAAIPCCTTARAPVQGRTKRAFIASFYPI